MPAPATPRHSATVTRPRLSRNGSAPPLPAEITPVRPQPPDRFRTALTQLRTMIRRIARRP